MNTPDDNDHDAGDLARFQSALLDLLHESLTVEKIRQRLRSDPEFAAYREYVDAMEPRMLAVAAELTKKWGVRKE